MVMDKSYFLERLAKSRPSAFEANSYDFLPEFFLAHDKIPIACHAHGIFHQKAYIHLAGGGCASCYQENRGDARALTTEDFIEKSRLRFGTRFNYNKTKYVRKDLELTITCSSHGDIKLTSDQHRWSKHGCPQCDLDIPRRIKGMRVLEKANKVHGGRYGYGKVAYVNMNDKVEILCPEHGSFWQNLYAHVARAQGCPSCSRAASRSSLSDFLSKARTIHGQRYDYSKVKYETNASMVVITCSKHGDFIQRAASHLAGNACKQCFLEENRLSAEEFITNAQSVHSDSYDYRKVVYRGNKQPVEIVCPKHGSFWQKPNTHVSSRNGCRFCSESKGEKAVEVFLKKYGIDYIREYRVLPYLYRYDFYLPGLDVYIEFHGLQHYKPVEQFGGQAAYLKTKENDERKKEIVAQKGGRLIVLTYLSLSADSVEKELIRKLKRIYSYWLQIDGKIRVFKTLSEIYSTFGVPLAVLFRDLIDEVKRTEPSLKVLF